MCNILIDSCRDVPSKWKSDFETETNSSKEKIKSLKEKIRRSGLEVYDDYPCEWGGLIDGKPMVGKLEHFGTRVLNNLWNAILKSFPDEEAVQDEISHDASLHEACIEDHLNMFVGRKALLKQCLDSVSSSKHGLIVLSGKAGSGKSAVMAAVVDKLRDKKTLLWVATCDTTLYRWRTRVC
ncbi:telomerase protein component 1-like [Saccoglossus kowalevskii]